MSIQEIIGGGSGLLIILLSLIQIAPVKLNPWSAILNWLGKQLNQDVCKKFEKLSDDVENMKKEIDTVREEARENQAKTHRVQILRFADEIYQGTNHSKEHYEQVLRDVKHYEYYCDTHKEFKNHSAVAAIKRIKSTYEEHLENHDFLE